MRKGKRIAMAAALVGGACLWALSGGQALAKELTADEMSSVEWRDCAGHFFFLGQKINQESGDRETVERFNMLALMAVYASETKAKAEARAGKTGNGLGRPTTDPKTGKPSVDLNAMLVRHREKAKAQGQESYINAYAAKCLKPVAAYSQRFADNMRSAKK